MKDFVNWYNTEGFMKSTNDIGGFYPYVDVEELINKIIVFYEMRYPNDYLKTSCSVKENNPFNKELLEEGLSWDERMYLHPTRYINFIHLGNVFGSMQSIELDRDGYITGVHLPAQENQEFIGMHITELEKYFKELGIVIPGINKVLENYHTQEFIREQIKDVVLEELAARSPGEIGLRRAFLFSKEQGHDLTLISRAAILIGDDLLSSKIDEEMNVRMEKYKNLSLTKNK